MRVGIFYHTDPLGIVPSGIDSFIAGILQWAPRDIEYTLFGATTDARARPVGQLSIIDLGGRAVRYIPLIEFSASRRSHFLPLTARYVLALRGLLLKDRLADIDVLDFHRIEPVLAFPKRGRCMNVYLHQDMAILRHKDSDIKWRHAPRLYEGLERVAFQRVDRVFCVRSSAVDRYKQSYPDCASKFEFIPTWVDVTIFRPVRDPGERDALRNGLRVELRLDSDAKLLVFVGRLDRQKDPQLLLRAFSKVADRDESCHLIVIGDGALRREVEQIIEAKTLRRRVTVLGAKSRSDIARYLQACDLFVMSSAYEGMPIAVLEALASGLPVVSTDVGEIRLVVRHGVNGRICRDRTPDDLAKNIEAALDSLDAIRGAPCVDSTRDYCPDVVLSRIYENHRAQASRGRL